MENAEGGPPAPLPRDGERAAAAPTSALLWASLLPLLFLLRPYGGLIQDARIYVGRGLADLDPAGLGRDMLFADDPQTGFSLLRPAMRALLGVLPAGQVSMLLAFVGLLLWLAAALALARGLASGPTAWAAVVAMLALPADYGAFGTFGYAEAIATPRVFAEAAVMAGLAALLRDRRVAGLAGLGAALALHPLMALPGLAIGAVLLVRQDRRWRMPLAGCAAALLAAAALHLPLADRLFVPMDAEWWSILRGRSINLFPRLWPEDMVARMACHLAAVAVAGGLLPGRRRALLWGAGAVAVAGVLAALVFGDVVPSVLVVQLQLWRALWPLAVLGNAALVLAAVAAWKGGTGVRLTVAVLLAAWCAEASPPLALLLSLAALALHVAERAGRLDGLPPRSASIAGLSAALLALHGIASDGAALAGLLGAMGDDGGEPRWRFVVGSGILGTPLVIAAVTVVIRPPPARRRPAAAAAGGLAAASLAALLLWDSRSAEHRMVEEGRGAAELKAALGPAPGEVLWIDDETENWFLAGRPAFFDALHGAPILFSRDFARDWAERGATLRALGLARPTDLAPWGGAPGGSADLALSPAAVARFCADPRRPAALVAPGSQLDAVPGGLSAALWRPPVSLRRLSVEAGAFRWRRIDAFTVVRCAPPVGEGQPASLNSVTFN